MPSPRNNKNMKEVLLYTIKMITVFGISIFISSYFQYKYNLSYFKELLIFLSVTSVCYIFCEVLIGIYLAFKQ